MKERGYGLPASLSTGQGGIYERGYGLPASLSTGQGGIYERKGLWATS